MCGRYHVDSEDQLIEMREIIDEINRKHNGTEKLAEMKTGEIFPTNVAPVIGAAGADLMAWGFPMHGSSKTIINARSETAREKPMFSKPLSERRVVVPTSGFYEWTHENKKTLDKYLFSLPGEKILYLAGLYTEFNLPSGRETRFTILTTAANDSMKPFHDRMPVYLSKAECDTWISDSAFTEEALRRVQPRLVASLVPKNEPVQLSLF